MDILTKLQTAAAVWNKMKSKDIRNVLALAKLVHSIDDVSWLIQTFKNYGKIPGGMDNPYGDGAYGDGA